MSVIISLLSAACYHAHPALPCVSNDDNMLLTRPLSKDEFKEAILSIHHDKSLSPDGLDSSFNQHFRGDLGED